MPPKPLAVPVAAADFYEDYLAWLRARGVGNKSFYSAARAFLVCFPDPQAWAGLPLADRLLLTGAQAPLVNFLMLHGHLQPGYDFLLERKLHAVLRDAAVTHSGRPWRSSWPAPSAWAIPCGLAPVWLQKWPCVC